MLLENLNKYHIEVICAFFFFELDMCVNLVKWVCFGIKFNPAGGFGNGIKIMETCSMIIAHNIVSQSPNLADSVWLT